MTLSAEQQAWNDFMVKPVVCDICEREPINSDDKALWTFGQHVDIWYWLCPSCGLMVSAGREASAAQQDTRRT